MATTNGRIVLAFDIERSGATNEYDTIAIGASVVNQDFEELDSLFLPGYFSKKIIVAGPKCYPLQQAVEQASQEAEEQASQEAVEQASQEAVEQASQEAEAQVPLEAVVSPIICLPPDNIVSPIICLRPHDLVESTTFEPRCWDEFWSNNLDILSILKYHGPLTKSQRQKEMITQFQEFRANWETWAKENNYEYLLVSDNSVFDGGFVNQMIHEHLPGAKPIPYSASTGEYSSFGETHSAQRGLLMYVDQYTKEWGFSERINELFNVPEQNKPHDHNPANDAYTIAFDQQVLFAIQDGKIDLRDVGDLSQSQSEPSQSEHSQSEHSQSEHSQSGSQTESYSSSESSVRFC